LRQLIQQKHTGGGKIAEIILIFYCISVLYPAFDENCGDGRKKKVNL